MYEYFISILIISWIVEPCLGYVTCKTACRECRNENNSEEIINIYCSMCQECRERRLERLDRVRKRRISRRQLVFKPIECPAPTPCSEVNQYFPEGCPRPPQCTRTPPPTPSFKPVCSSCIKTPTFCPTCLQSMQTTSTYFDSDQKSITMYVGVPPKLLQ